MIRLPDKAASSSDASAARLAQEQRAARDGRRLRWKVRRAQAVLAASRAWPALWLPMAVAGVFLLMSLHGVWPLLPAELRRAMLWTFGAAQLLAFVPLFRLTWPTEMEALRHMENAAGLPHRPATSYHDQLASAETASPATNQLWAVHRERARRLFAQLKPGWPRPRMDRADPFALRVALLLLLGVGFIAHRDDAASRIKAAFQPIPSAPLGAARLDAWITPPLYTGKPPVMLADGSRSDPAATGNGKSFLAPFKSEFTARVNQANASGYSLRLKPMVGKTKTIAPTLSSGKTNFAEFKETLTASGDIELLDGSMAVARWTVDIIVDTAPKIALIEPPAEAQRGSLRFRYKVEDDYGVVSASALIERAASASAEESADYSNDGGRPFFSRRLGTPPVAPLTLPRANAKSGEGQTYRDLTPHFWAGLPVTVTLEARDQAGQIGRSAPQTFILPERQFSNPFARAIIEQRKKLVSRPDRKDNVAEALDALTIAPDLFVPGKKVYLGLRTAYWRLRRAGSEEELESAADLLWHVALHIEEGDLSDAERQLRTAQDALMRALERNAPDAEIKRLMADLRAALDRFVENARKHALNEQFDPKREFGNQRVVTPKDLEQMLKEIEDLARTGSKEAAGQMLSQLRELLENSRTGNRGGGRNREAMAMLDGLSEIIKKQQKLLDETFRVQNENPFGEDGEAPGGEAEEGAQNAPGLQGQDGGSGSGGQGNRPERGQARKPERFAGLRNEQTELHKQLRQLLDKLGGMGTTPPDNLEGAATAMNGASKSLGDGDGERATRQQALALEKLRSGTKALAEQMMKNSGSSRGGTASGEGRDPLGRPMPNRGGLDNGESVKVPNKGELDLQRAREILDELRRRLGDRSRPTHELEYIERLIERF